MRSRQGGHPCRYAILGVIVLATILIGAGAGTAGANPSEPATVQVKGVTTPALGKVLVDSGGMTLYTFRGDNPLLYQFFQDPAPSCYELCAEFWPPVLTNGAPKATGGVDGKLLGTLSREDGATQVTYDGHPLYRCSEDMRPGEANGEDIEMFGDAWYAINPNGEEA